MNVTKKHSDKCLSDVMSNLCTQIRQIVVNCSSEETSPQKLQFNPLYKSVEQLIEIQGRVNAISHQNEESKSWLSFYLLTEYQYTDFVHDLVWLLNYIITHHIPQIQTQSVSKLVKSLTTLLIESSKVSHVIRRYLAESTSLFSSFRTLLVDSSSPGLSSSKKGVGISTATNAVNQQQSLSIPFLLDALAHFASDYSSSVTHLTSTITKLIFNLLTWIRELSTSTKEDDCLIVEKSLFLLTALSCNSSTICCFLKSECCRQDIYRILAISQNKSHNQSKIACLINHFSSTLSQTNLTLSTPSSSDMSSSCNNISLKVISSVFVEAYLQSDIPQLKLLVSFVKHVLLCSSKSSSFLSKWIVDESTQDNLMVKFVQNVADVADFNSNQDKRICVNDETFHMLDCLLILHEEGELVKSTTSPLIELCAKPVQQFFEKSQFVSNCSSVNNSSSVTHMLDALHLSYHVLPYLLHILKIIKDENREKSSLNEVELQNLKFLFDSIINVLTANIFRGDQLQTFLTHSSKGSMVTEQIVTILIIYSQIDESWCLHLRNTIDLHQFIDFLENNDDVINIKSDINSHAFLNVLKFVKIMSESDEKLRDRLKKSVFENVQIADFIVHVCLKNETGRLHEFLGIFDEVKDVLADNPRKEERGKFGEENSEIDSFSNESERRVCMLNNFEPENLQEMLNDVSVAMSSMKIEESEIVKLGELKRIGDKKQIEMMRRQIESINSTNDILHQQLLHTRNENERLNVLLNRSVFREGSAKLKRDDVIKQFQQLQKSQHQYLKERERINEDLKDLSEERNACVKKITSYKEANETLNKAIQEHVAVQAELSSALEKRNEKLAKKEGLLHEAMNVKECLEKDVECLKKEVNNLTTLTKRQEQVMVKKDKQIVEMQKELNDARALREQLFKLAKGPSS